jgi:Ca2+-binding EF-hand superfamily protein
LDVVMDGNAPTAAWDEFLDQLFDFFDRDGDGSLSKAEVGRMCPLPRAGRAALTVDFTALDADGDGKASRAELKAFCRNNGFTPVVAVVEVASPDDLRLGQLLFAALDADGDGKLSKAELQRAPDLLRKFDLNEDEFLTPEELLASAAPARRPGEASVRLADSGDKEDAVLRVDLGAKAKSATLEGDTLYRLAALGSDGLHRLHGPAGRWSAVFRTTRSTPDVRLATDFLVAQFKTALGDAESLSKADLEQDATLSGLRELFPYADRNGDGRLSIAELEAYLKLIERGVGSQVWIRLQDRGQNPFPFLDVDGDGRLSYRELARAADLLDGEKEADGLPRQFQFAFGGPTVNSWGGVQLPTTHRKPQRDTIDRSPVPRWFEAMDRNNDGVISPREFLGPPELFRKLDLDGDGVISVEEARRADK